MTIPYRYTVYYSFNGYDTVGALSVALRVIITNLPLGHPLLDLVSIINTPIWYVFGNIVAELFRNVVSPFRNFRNEDRCFHSDFKTFNKNLTRTMEDLSTN